MSGGDDDAKDKRRPAGGAVRRSVARLAAVQGLYQVTLSAAGIEDVIRQFLSGRPDWMASDQPGIAKMDQALFCEIVRGVATDRDRIDAMIEASLSKGRSVERLEVLLRLILECGAWELASRADVPAKVIVSEYLGIADAFFEGDQPSLVNAVLDKLARNLRDVEMSARGGDGPTKKGRA
ncbi:MAG: transcription antitermination factor NusB [Gemmatimonas sp.]